MEDPETKQTEEHRGRNLYIKGVDLDAYDQFSACCKLMKMQYAELFQLMVEDYCKRKGRHLKADSQLGRRRSLLSILRNTIMKMPHRDAGRGV